MVGTLVFLVTARTLSNGYVNLDDSLYITRGPATEGLTGHAIAFAFTSVGMLYWHPMAWLSHALDFEVFGSAASGHHFTSLILHAAAAALLCLVLRRLGAGRFAAVAGSVLWAVHPLRVESFAWVAERKDVLCAFFSLLTILAYLDYVERRSRGRYAGWLCCAALALMSKPSAVSVPILLLVLDWWLRRPVPLVRLLLEKLPLVAMSSIVSALTVLGQQRAGAIPDFALGTRLANAVVGQVRYLGKIFWPVNLGCFYPYDTQIAPGAVILGALLLASITTLALLQRRRRPYLLAGWLWFVFALLPNAGIIQAGRQSIADRFTHMPMIGIVIAVVWAAAEATKRYPAWRKPAVWAMAGTFAALAVLTVRQIGYWRNGRTLAEHAISVQDSDYMRENLADTLMREGRYAEAQDQLRAAIRLAPGAYEHYNNLANALLRTGPVEAALREAEIARRLAPNSLAVAETLGLVLLRSGDYQRCANEFAHAVQLGADRTPIAVKLSDAGAALASRGQPSQAEVLVRKALEMNPALVQARRNLVLLLLDQGRTRDARMALEDAVRNTGSQPAYGDLEREFGGRRSPPGAL